MSFKPRPLANRLPLAAPEHHHPCEMDHPLSMKEQENPEKLTR